MFKQFFFLTQSFSRAFLELSSAKSHGELILLLRVIVLMNSSCRLYIIKEINGQGEKRAFICFICRYMYMYRGGVFCSCMQDPSPPPNVATTSHLACCSNWSTGRCRWWGGLFLQCILDTSHQIVTKGSLVLWTRPREKQSYLPLQYFCQHYFIKDIMG